MKANFRSLGILIFALTATCLSGEAPATFKVSTFTFTRPATWQSIEPSSTMRKAQLKITDDKTKGTAEVIFFHFGAGAGGDTQSNVTRWFSQFEEPREKINARTEETTVGSHKVTYVYAEGTYRSGMPGASATPMSGYELAGAIIEDSDGSVFVRMTGPKDLVKSALPDFKKMIEGALK